MKYELPRIVTEELFFAGTKKKKKTKKTKKEGLNPPPYLF